MRVGIDLDGVCADYIGAVRLAGRELGYAPPGGFLSIHAGTSPLL